MRQSLIENALTSLSLIKARLFTGFIAPGFYAIGKGSLIVPPFKAGNIACVLLGAGVTIHNNCWLLALIDTGNAPSPKLTIKDGSVIGSNATISAAKSVVIGEQVLFAGNVFVSDHGHAYENCERPICDQGIRKIEGVSIGDGSWVGQNAVILPGSMIGKHCVVGANAVVNSVIPDFSVAAGNPARVIKRYNDKTNTWETHGGPCNC